MDYPLADLPEDEEYNQYGDQPSPSSSTQGDYYASDADNYNNPRRRKQMVLAGLSLILVVMLVLPLAVVLWAPLLRPVGISLLQRLAGVLRFLVMTSAISAGIFSTSNNGSHKSDDHDRKEGAKTDAVQGKWGRNSIRSRKILDMPANGDPVVRSNIEKGKGILASNDDDAIHDDKGRAWRELKMKATEAEIVDSSSGGGHQDAGYGGEIEASMEIKEADSPQSSASSAASSSLRRFQKFEAMEIREPYVQPEVSAPSMDELWRKNMRAGTSADRINALKREDAPRRTIQKQRSLEGSFVSPLKPQHSNILYSNAAGSLHHRSSAFANQAAAASTVTINQPVRAHSGSKTNVASGGGNSVQAQKLGPNPVTNHHEKVASSHHNSVKDQRLGPNPPVTNYDKAASSHYNVVKDQKLGPNPVTKVASSHHNTNANISVNKHHQHVLLSSKKHSRSDDNLHKVASSSSSSSSPSSSRPQSSNPSSSTIRSRRQRGTSVSYDFGADYGPEWLYDLDPLPSPDSIFVAGFNRPHQHDLHPSSSLSAASSSASSVHNIRPTASQPLIEATEAQSLVPWRVAGSQPIDIVRPRNASQHNVTASAPSEDASNDGDDQASPINTHSLKKRADDFIAKFNEQLLKQKRESLERRREWSMMHGGQPPP